MEETMIMVGHGKMQEIAKVFGISESMVSKSLRGHRKGSLAKKIRYVALTQFGGREMQAVAKEKGEGNKKQDKPIK